MTTNAQEPTNTTSGGATGKMKKWLIAAALILAVGVGAFFLGKSRGGSAGHSKVAHQAAAHGNDEVVRHEGSGIERERQPQSPSRQPASTQPAVSPEPDTEEKYEREDAEEIEVQVAHSPKKPTTHGKSVVGEAHAAEKSHGAKKAEKHSDEQEEVVAHQSKADHHAVAKDEKKGFFARLIGTYADAWQSVQDKVRELQRAEEENRRLRLENAHLRVMVESQKYGCRIEETKKHAQKVGAKLNAETGTRVARTLASVNYQMPENLLPEQLHALGVGYFKSKDFEKAAVIFTFLTEMEGESVYRTADNFLMTGVSWYHLENYKLSSVYFDRVLKELPSDQNAQARVQAKVWQALAAQRQKNFGQSQKWLKETLENHPQTQEARWINPQEGDRQPASRAHGSGKKTEAKAETKKKADEAHHDEHHEEKAAHH